MQYFGRAAIDFSYFLLAFLLVIAIIIAATIVYDEWNNHKYLPDPIIAMLAFVICTIISSFLFDFPHCALYIFLCEVTVFSYVAMIILVF